MSKHDFEARLEELDRDLRTAEADNNGALVDQIIMEIECLVDEFYTGEDNE